MEDLPRKKKKDEWVKKSCGIDGTLNEGEKREIWIRALKMKKRRRG